MEIREVEVLANRRIRGLPPDTAATSFSKAACPPAGGAVKLTLTSVPLFATKFSRTFWRATDSGCTAGFHPQKSMATPLTSAGRGAPPSSPPHPIAQPEVFLKPRGGHSSWCVPLEDHASRIPPVVEFRVLAERQGMVLVPVALVVGFCEAIYLDLCLSPQ